MFFFVQLLNPINSGRNAPGEINFAEISAPYYYSHQDKMMCEGHIHKLVILSFDFEEKDNPTFHKPKFYGFHQGKILALFLYFLNYFRKFLKIYFYIMLTIVSIIIKIMLIISYMLINNIL